ncbi:MAG TPA: alkaline phosphatase [Bacteroidales bacterium]|nr:alkaline phosphatase [Bacteroidales bacterium]
MKRYFSFIVLIFLMLSVVLAQEVRPTKNLIVMIPDGTSQSVLSAARWLKVYRNEGTRLHIDPYLSGSVTTFSSNAPIGDSAPTTSCYMTGVPQQAGNISIYPVADPENDLVKLNRDSAYQPLATILEAMKMEQGKAAGIVATCEFPHATPADCASHHYNRSKYEFLAPQMAFNNVDVVFGGGNEFVSSAMKEHFQNNGTTYIQDDKRAMMNFFGEKVWALFGERAMPYDLDRNSETTPSISEMTEKAIEVLNKNENGFFLMVEGSKVDWAAHANDPVGMVSEYLAFDEAVGKAIEFAKKDGNTTVVILPDHSNSGFSIGRNGLKKSYSSLTLEELFGQLSKIKYTAEGLEKILLQTKPEDFKSVFEENTGIELSDEKLKTLTSSKNYKVEDYTKAANANNLTHNIIVLLNSKMPFGFTTGGHTGEEVFLAVYHPQGDILKGNVRNTEVHDYLYAVTGLEKSMKQLTGEIYAKHTDIFDGFKYSIEGDKDFPKLAVKNKGNTLEINAFTSVAYLNGKPFDLGSVAVYIDKNNMFYLPKNLVDKIK